MITIIDYDRNTVVYKYIHTYGEESHTILETKRKNHKGDKKI